MKTFYASASAAALLLALVPLTAQADEFGTLLHTQTPAASVADTDELYILLGGTTPGKVLGNKFVRPGGDAGTPSAINLLNGTLLPINVGTTGTLPFNRIAVTGVATGAKFVRDDGVLAIPAGNGTGAASAGATGNIQISSDGAGGFGSFVPGFGVQTLLTTPSSANLLTALAASHTGSGLVVFGTSPSLVSPSLGIPTSVDLTNATNLPIAVGSTGSLPFNRLALTGSPTGAKFVRDDGVLAIPAGNGGGAASAGATGNIQISSDGAGGFGSFAPATGIQTFLTTPNSANLRAALIDETGTGLAVFHTSPTFITPSLGTIASGDLSNATNVPMSAATGTLQSTHGGTGQTAYTNGQVLIGNTATGGLSKATITAGTNVTVTNGAGTITIAASAGSATAGGTDGQIQVNSGNALAGRTIGNGLLDDGTNFGLTSLTNNQSTGGYPLVATDAATTVLVGAFTYTIPQAGTTGFGSGWSACLLNIAAGNATVNTTTSVFKGASGTTSQTLRPKSWICPASDGTNYQTVLGSVDGGDLTAATVTNAALATMATHTFKGNNTGGTAAPLDLTRAQMVADLFDSLSSTQGAVLYRNAATWVALPPGTNGQSFTSGGAAANPSWTTPAGGGNVIGSGATTSGNLLQSNNTGGTLGTATDTGIAASAVLTASSTTTLSNKSIDCTTNTCNNFPRTLNYGWIPTIDPNEDVIYTVATGATTVTLTSIRGTVVAPIGAAGTVQFNKTADGAACSAGTNLATGTFNANGTANTNQTLTLIGSPTLVPGDRICVISTGSGWTTGVAKAGITFTLRVL